MALTAEQQKLIASLIAKTQSSNVSFDDELDSQIEEFAGLVSQIATQKQVITEQDLENFYLITKDLPLLIKDIHDPIITRTATNIFTIALLKKGTKEIFSYASRMKAMNLMHEILKSKNRRLQQLLSEGTNQKTNQHVFENSHITIANSNLTIDDYIVTETNANVSEQLSAEKEKNPQVESDSENEEAIQESSDEENNDDSIPQKELSEGKMEEIKVMGDVQSVLNNSMNSSSSDTRDSSDNSITYSELSEGEKEEKKASDENIETIINSNSNANTSTVQTNISSENKMKTQVPVPTNNVSPKYNRIEEQKLIEEINQAHTNYVDAAQQKKDYHPFADQLKKFVITNPDNIIANFFYGKYLVDKKERAFPKFKSDPRPDIYLAFALENGMLEAYFPLKQYYQLRETERWEYKLLPLLVAGALKDSVEAMKVLNSYLKDFKQIEIKSSTLLDDETYDALKFEYALLTGNAYLLRRLWKTFYSEGNTTKSLKTASAFLSKIQKELPALYDAIPAINSLQLTKDDCGILASIYHNHPDKMIKSIVLTNSNEAIDVEFEQIETRSPKDLYEELEQINAIAKKSKKIFNLFSKNAVKDQTTALVQELKHQVNSNKADANYYYGKYLAKNNLFESKSNEDSAIYQLLSAVRNENVNALKDLLDISYQQKPNKQLEIQLKLFVACIETKISKLQDQLINFDSLGNLDNFSLYIFSFIKQNQAHVLPSRYDIKVEFYLALLGTQQNNLEKIMQNDSKFNFKDEYLKVKCTFQLDQKIIEQMDEVFDLKNELEVEPKNVNKQLRNSN